MNLEHAIVHLLKKEQHQKSASIQCRNDELDVKNEKVVDLVAQTLGVYRIPTRKHNFVKSLKF